MAGHTVPKVFEGLPITVVPPTRLTGPSRTTRPTRSIQNLRDLQRGDRFGGRHRPGLRRGRGRCFVVDERGLCLALVLTALIAVRELAREPGASVIYNHHAPAPCRDHHRARRYPLTNSRRALVHQGADGRDGARVRRRHSATSTSVTSGTPTRDARCPARAGGARQQDARCPTSWLVTAVRGHRRSTASSRPGRGDRAGPRSSPAGPASRSTSSTG
jgi:hypothetical protein